MRRSSRHLPLATAQALSLIALLSSCGDPPAQETPSSAIVVDSGGIRVVSVSAPLMAPGAWVVEQSPRMRCTADDATGDPRIRRVTDLVSLGDGSVAIVSQANVTVLVCRDGKVEETYGTPGEGPGEFQGLVGAVHGPGDSITVVGVAKFGVFARDGSGAMREVRLQQAAGGEISRFATTPSGVAGNRVAGGNVVQEAEGAVRLVFLNPDGTVRDTIEEVPWSTSLGTLTPVTLWDVDPRFEVGVDDFWYARWDRFQIDRYGSAGLTQIIRTPSTPIVVQETDRDRAVDLIVENDGVPERIARRLVTQGIEPGRDEAVPAVLDVLLNGSSEVWVRIPESDPGVSPRVWRVLRPDGEWVTDVAVPAGFKLLEVDGDAAIGVVTDEFGLETVEVRTIVRG